MRTRRILVAAAVIGAMFAGDISFDRAPLGIPAPQFRLAAQAEAVIGRPLTPLSYAGVARRTARRTARRVARRTAYYLTALPPSCVYGPYYDAYYYNCGGSYYVRDNDVYVQVVFD